MSPPGSARPEVWVVRHGETEWSKSGQHTGRTDIDLTAEGETAARAIGQRLQGESFDVVLSSPLQRARRTAELAGFGDVLEVDADLREWDYGEYEGRRTVDIRETVPDWSIWTHPAEEGESLAEVAARADAVVTRILATEGRVLVVSHGHFSRVLAARWVTLPPEAGQHLVLDTAGLGVLGWYRETPVLRRWNA